MSAPEIHEDGPAAPRSSRSQWGCAFAALLTAIFLVSSATSALWFLINIPSSLREVTSRRVIELKTADGHDLFRRGQLQLRPVAVQDLPPDVINAVLSIEDRHFYEHGSVDFLSMLRAFIQNREAGKIVAGGSTITQQLVKITFLSPERTYNRKIQEATISFWLEHHLSKDEILTAYLNNVYLGSGTVGFPAAAKVYFGKKVGDLSLAEAAMLAGMINAPSQDDPFHNVDAAHKRAGVVLDAMVENGKITAETAMRAKLHPAIAAQTEISPPATGWFADWVYDKATAVAPAYGGPVSLRTTIDLRLQQLAANVVNTTLAKFGDEKHASQAALLAMRPDGAVLAMVGGRSYTDSQYNRAVQAQRQPGSAFKLFDYYAAFRQGMGPQDKILDAPVDLHGWHPENYGHRNHGEVTLADAFANSLNDAAVRLAQQVGIRQVIAAARDLGLHARLQNNPSLALGTSEVTLLDLTSAYAAVRAGKTPVTPYGISGFRTAQDSDYVAVDRTSEAQHSLGQYQAQLIGLLRGVVERGTGRPAALDRFAAGKTGTTQDYRDAWFIGFDDFLVVGVWVGNDDHSPMKGVTGGLLPAKIWKDFMQEANVPSMAGAIPEPAVTTVGQSQVQPEVSSNAATTGTPPTDAQGGQCNVPACERSYSSFRGSDCTYQPYSGGPRQHCDH
ncbi:PBP1A family penicillin-binding protein [Bradyrhizobium sp.]|uniref:PBP1A family penicillin-binding protein n=1 Tax=Bradyrhizobium sp. TaxID=376 RepID=UPI0025C287C2|nr:PBP1A family penicillin-binding protein [Bradyrhizobium sp.]